MRGCPRVFKVKYQIRLDLTAVAFTVTIVGIQCPHHYSDLHSVCRMTAFAVIHVQSPPPGHRVTLCFNRTVFERCSPWLQAANDFCVCLYLIKYTTSLALEETHVLCEPRVRARARVYTRFRHSIQMTNFPSIISWRSGRVSENYKKGSTALKVEFRPESYSVTDQLIGPAAVTRSHTHSLWRARAYGVIKILFKITTPTKVNANRRCTATGQLAHYALLTTTKTFATKSL